MSQRPIQDEVDVDDMIQHRRDSHKHDPQQRRRSSRKLPSDVELNSSIRHLSDHSGRHHNNEKDLEANGKTPAALDHHSDARLHWENITLTVQNTNNSSAKVSGNTTTILDNVWGESPKGQISAIMVCVCVCFFSFPLSGECMNEWISHTYFFFSYQGPSGSGKTSLLNVLAGRMSNATANFTVEADKVTWNGHALDVTDLSTRQMIAFVAQDDSLPVTSTPREAILFSARLRLNKEKTMDELVEITETMLQQLHLESCADTYVGGALLKGISGGERKRTSVGVELVVCTRSVVLTCFIYCTVLWMVVFSHNNKSPFFFADKPPSHLFGRTNKWFGFLQCTGTRPSIETSRPHGIRCGLDHSSTILRNLGYL